jgi:AcrR family transcriptional regulator
VSPQRSNRQVLLEGALRCVERLPAERITARVIADESGANAASIVYHFGSKDELMTEAVIAGLDRWLEEIAADLGELAQRPSAERLRAAFELVERSRTHHAGLARNFVTALARAQHEPKIRRLLADGFRHTRPNVAGLLGLGSDQAGDDAAGLMHSMFTGLLFQVLLDPSLAIDGDRMAAAQTRLRAILPEARD